MRKIAQLLIIGLFLAAGFQGVAHGLKGVTWLTRNGLNANDSSSVIFLTGLFSIGGIFAFIASIYLIRNRG